MKSNAADKRNRKPLDASAQRIEQSGHGGERSKLHGCIGATQVVVNSEQQHQQTTAKQDGNSSQLGMQRPGQ